MSGDVVAAIDAALEDNSIGPDAMRHAPDAPEHPAVVIERLLREVRPAVGYFADLDARLDTTALNRAFSDVTETFRRAGEQLQARGGMGFPMPQVTIFDEVPAPEPLVTYEPSWPPPFVAHTGQTAITMEARSE